MISDNYCLRTNGWFGLYFDEGSQVLHRHATTCSRNTGTWATANYWGGENIGNFTVTGNWTTNGSTNITNGDRGNVVNNNVTVTNGAWPAGAQAVMAAAGAQGQPAGEHGRARGRGVGPVPGRQPEPRRPTAPRRRSGTATAAANQQWTADRRRSAAGVRRASAWT